MANELLDNLKKLVDEGNYEEAAVLLPNIKDQKAKTASDFIALAKAYGKTGDFEKGMRCFNKAYKLRPSKLLYREMIELCIECGEASTAEKMYTEYRRMAPGDKYNILLFKYKILKLSGEHRLKLIDALIALNDCEYTETYAYELAKQLHKAGMADECLAECKRICETFDNSPITQKAATLYAFYTGEVSAEEIKDAANIAKQKQENAEKLKHDISLSEIKMQPMIPEEDEADLKLIGAAVQSILDGEKVVEAPAYEEEELPAVLFSVSSESESESEAEIKAETEDEIPEPSVQEEETASKEAQDSNPYSVYTTPENFEEEEYVLPDNNANAELTSSEQGFLMGLEYNRREMSAKHYDTFAPKSDFNVWNLKEGKIKRLILERDVKVEEILKGFSRIAEIRNSVFKACEIAANQRDKISLVMLGEDGSGKTTLAVRMVRLMYKMGILRYDRVAKIDGDVLNGIDLSEKRAQLLRCNILVENAGMLKPKALDALMEEFGDVRSGTCIILEDSIKNITGLLRSREDYVNKFNNRISLPKYDENHLMGFACDMFAEEDYRIEKDAAALLSGYFASLSPTKRNVKTAAEAAGKIIANADKRLAPLILKMAAEAAYDEFVELVIVKEDLIL